MTDAPAPLVSSAIRPAKSSLVGSASSSAPKTRASFAALWLRIRDDHPGAHPAKGGHRAQPDRAGAEDDCGVRAVDISGAPGGVVAATERVPQGQPGRRTVRPGPGATTRDAPRNTRRPPR